MTVDRDERPMFILDMANNHMGSVDHALRIIDEFATALKGLPFQIGFKLQYRQLDTFIHPDFVGRDEFNYVKRFSETRLDPDQMLVIKNAIADAGFTTVCTPFDNESVDVIEAHDFDIIKVASCSFTDWPLLERIAATSKPLVVSSGGATLEEIDQVVSFLSHRNKDLSLMHCVAEYPTPNSHLNIGQIRMLAERYPGVRVGFSTHESPDQTDPVKMAVAAGAKILERHVGVPTDEWPLNKYSGTPAQTRAWIEAAAQAVEAYGSDTERYTPSASELESLRGLRRGVFAKVDIPAGGTLTLANTMLAIPTVQGQLTANDLSKYRVYTANDGLAAGAAAMAADMTRTNTRETANEIVQEIKEYLVKTGTDVPGRLSLEISHHYGIERFHEYGMTIITFVNREYCKKLLVVLPGQRHPEQYHTEKEETFHVLQGTVELILDGVPSELTAGDIVTVERGVRHEFFTETGCIIEEVSSTHLKADSYYTDPAIAANPNRKTVITYWLE
jgi:sialic acid synthase SpsE/mannose-6-phosphate isomerase-like protein (cupin superfamily)